MLLIGQHGGPPSDMLGAGIGVAAVLLVVGWAITRWQRDRQRFALMQTALEKGVTRFPGTPPYWLVSLRQGVTLTAVGVGLMVVGGGAWGLTANVEMPAATPAPALTAPASQATPQAAPKTPAAPTETPAEPNPPHEGWNHAPHFQGGPPPEGPEDRDGPGGEPRGPHRDLPPDQQGPHGRGFDRGPNPEMAGPPQREPHESPDRERWHRAEAQKTIGLVSVGMGFILTLLGLVRIGFAKIEQNYTRDSDDLGVS